jgi:DNA-binding NarL/FixJ family response regulator
MNLCRIKAQRPLACGVSATILKGAQRTFLLVHEDADFARAALDAGALGYVVKARLASDLLPAIRAALADRSFISPTMRLDEARPTSPDLVGKPLPTERKP